MKRLIIRGGRIVDPAGKLDKKGDLAIAGERIVEISDAIEPGPEDEVFDASGCVVCPGLVDIHVHLREPGYEDRETIWTGTQAAAAGGITTVCCMPNTEPPIDSSAVVNFVKGRPALVQVNPIGCITKNRAGAELAEMGDMLAAGAVAFSDDGSPVADSGVMRRALEYAKGLGAPIISHPEDVTLSQGGHMNYGRTSLRLGLEGIPAEAETIAVNRDCYLAGLTGGRLHLAHISTAGALDEIRQARERGVAVTCETAPHYFTLTEEAVVGYRTNAKVNPPLRTEADRKAVVEALKDGTIDCIATDHAPHNVMHKEVEFALAANGISGLETLLGLVITHLVVPGHLDLLSALSLVTYRPAEVLGLPVGRLERNGPADVTVFDLDGGLIVDSRKLYSMGRNTPFDGHKLQGKVKATVVAGRLVYQEGGAPI